MASYDITSDSEAKNAVRRLTQYSDSDISTNDLDGVLSDAKREIALRAEATNWYSDRGLGHALVGMTAALAKGAVENSPVRIDNIGPNDVTFRTSDGDSLQVAKYEDMVQRGLAESDETTAGTQGIRLTNTWLNDTRSA